MGKKKGKGKKKGPVATGPGVDVLGRNYRQACKNIGVPPNAAATRDMGGGKGEEDGGIYTQLNLGDEPLGPGGARALCEAIFGKGTGMTGETYENLLAIRFWSCRIKDDGAIAVAELLVGIE